MINETANTPSSSLNLLGGDTGNVEVVTTGANDNNSEQQAKESGGGDGET